MRHEWRNIPLAFSFPFSLEPFTVIDMKRDDEYTTRLDAASVIT